jgi:hypothetical protein
MEDLVKLLSENALIILAKHAVTSNGNEDGKWQLAVQLAKLSDKKLVLQLLEQFVNDQDEYVVRRTIMELAKLQWDKTEFYCERIWNKSISEKYGEYQRMAVLDSLKTIKSARLLEFLALAKQDGRGYLPEFVSKFESELESTDTMREE